MVCLVALKVCREKFPKLNNYVLIHNKRSRNTNKELSQYVMRLDLNHA